MKICWGCVVGSSCVPRHSQYNTHPKPIENFRWVVPSVGCSLLGNTIISQRQKIWIFRRDGGRKNHGLIRFWTVGLWVVFLETDCKINAKFHQISAKFHQNHPPLFHNPNPKQISTTFPLIHNLFHNPNPNRQTTNQNPIWYRLQYYQPKYPHYSI